MLLEMGTQERPLGVQRSDKPRLWRSLDRCVEHLKKELHLVRFDRLDTAGLSGPTAPGSGRQDSADRLRRAHQAAAHDAWFRAQVQLALDEADDPAADWVSQDDADTAWARKKADLARHAETPAPPVAPAAR